MTKYFQRSLITLLFLLFSFSVFGSENNSSHSKNHSHETAEENEEHIHSDGCDHSHEEHTHDHHSCDQSHHTHIQDHHEHHHHSCDHSHDHEHHTHDHHDHDHSEACIHSYNQEHDHHSHSHNSIPLWLVIPFILLLGMIATGPVLYENFWHRNYAKIAVLLALSVTFYYLFVLKDLHHPVDSLFEYIQFIALISSLFIASGGILIKVKGKSGPIVNLTILLIGAVISNLIGTTGASMLLIRPFIRVNKDRLKVYHIVFFIFMVSNVGGALTPIGDPPLFLGFLEGVPFFLTS